MKIEAKIPVPAIQGEPRPLLHERGRRRTAPPQNAPEREFDETLSEQQQQQARDGRQHEQRQAAARARLALLAESLALLDERLLGASLPALLRAQPDLMWMAQELMWVLDDLRHDALLDDVDRHQAQCVLTRLRNEYAFLQARSGQRLTLALGDLFDAIGQRLQPPAT